MDGLVVFPTLVAKETSTAAEKASEEIRASVVARTYIAAAKPSIVAVLPRTAAASTVEALALTTMAEPGALWAATASFAATTVVVHSLRRVASAEAAPVQQTTVAAARPMLLQAGETTVVPSRAASPAAVVTTVGAKAIASLAEVVASGAVVTPASPAGVAADSTAAVAAEAGSTAAAEADGGSPNSRHHRPKPEG
jgi:hypothetical protein